MAYKHCTYTAQGRLECSHEKHSPKVSNDIPMIETFIQTAARGRSIDNVGVNVHFTERPTSKTIWDKKSANSICTPLCARFEQVWTQGFRSVGGSVCYCRDAPPPVAPSPVAPSPLIDNLQAQKNTKE